MKKKALIDQAWYLLLSFIAFIAILFYTNHGGIGVSPDSIAYVSVARNLTAGYGFTGYNDRPFVLFPLFYPTFLSGFMAVSRKDIVSIAPYINAFLFALTVYFSAKIIKVSHWLKVATLLWIVFSIGLLDVYTMLWSETLFIFLIIGFIILFNQYLNTNKTTFLVLSAIVVSMACITRYAAVTVLGTGLLLLFIDRQKQFRKRVADCLLFGLISIFPLAFNLVRNHLATGVLTGKRQPSVTPFFKNISLFGDVFIDWFAFFKTSSGLSIAVAIIILSAFVFLFIMLIIKNKQKDHVYIACGFFLVYGFFMVVSSSISRYEPINSRLLAPLFIPFVAVVSALMYKVQSIERFRVLKRVNVFVVLFFVMAQLKTDAKTYKNANEGGIGGYTDDSWKESSLIHFLKQNKQILTQQEWSVYSNASQAIYFYTNAPAINLPERKYKEDVREFDNEETFYLVWFNNEENIDLLGLKEVEAKRDMKVLHQFNDGCIYYCTAKPKAF